MLVVNAVTLFRVVSVVLIAPLAIEDRPAMEVLGGTPNAPLVNEAMLPARTELVEAEEKAVMRLRFVSVVLSEALPTEPEVR